LIASIIQYFFGLKISFHRVSNLKGPENTLFTPFQNPLGLATLFSPCFDFETASRHSFCPLSKSFGLCDTLFCRFQNHLWLARVFLGGSKIDLVLSHPRRVFHI
jgi:hypothetical protein